MLFSKKINLSIVAILIAAMLFSCDSDINKVQQLYKTSFVPTGEADSIHLKYTDSGKIKSILKSKKMLDYSGIKYPFTEFPNGIEVIIYDDNGNETTIKANAATSYKKTEIIDLVGNVSITTTDGKKLETEQLYFDQKNNWFFTEKHFKYTDAAGGFLQGPGVDFSKDFKIFNMQKSSGEVATIN